MKNDKYNVLFLPYKASMWDAFDSVYKAAVADNRCKVTVVSVPYYERKSQGEEKQLVCENGQYPDYVKETFYKEFVFEKMDIIFIHNPYDGTNKITQILPQYYSKELIKYTDHLVYIPYFVTKAGEAMQEHFCELPAVFYSWRTIVQSEDIRKVYLKYHSAEKIVAMGSPKFDRVKKICKTKEILIPDEWKDKLQGKKVFLYNTHLRKIYDGTIVDEVKYVLGVMAEYEDVVLLWRPHPLSTATAEQVNEQLAKNYIQLVEYVKKLQYVIYDETSDVDRTIVLSDAYIGDIESSVVQLYGITGKPIYDTEEWKEDDKGDNHFIKTLGAEIDGTNIWMTSINDNNLYVIDMITQKIRWQACFQREKCTLKNLYIGSVKNEQYFYFIPCMAQRIGVFSKKNMQVSYIDLPERKKNEYTPVLNNEYLWLFPIFFGKEMYRIDLNTRKVMILESAYKRDLMSFRNFGKIPLFGEAKKFQNKIYQPCFVASVISIYDIENDCFDYVEVPMKEKGLVAITPIEKVCWILPKEQGKLVKWDMENNCFYELIYMENMSSVSQELQFCDIVYENENIWLVPNAARVCIKIELSEGIVKEIMCWKTEDEQALYDRYKLYNGKIYLFPYKAKNICAIDMETDEVVWLSTYFDSEIMKNNTGVEDDIRRYIYNGRTCSLKQFIELVRKGDDINREKRRNSFCKGIENINENAGEKIWHYLIQQIDKQ